MYRIEIDRNNYHQNPKNGNVQTPLAVSEFLFALLNNLFDKYDIILDVGSGFGSSSEPWKIEPKSIVWLAMFI